MGKFEKVYDLNNLYHGFKCVKKASGWKERTQRYEEDMLFNLINLKQALQNKTYKPTPPNTFLLNERGKMRFIESQIPADRIVQRSLTDAVLWPDIRPLLTYDNAASLKGRGTEFFRKRLERHLRSFMAQHGDNGYILIIDFKKFFDNIRHEDLLSMFDYAIKDPEVLEFLKMLIYDHRIDVSYMSDEEYAHCMDVPFSSIDYDKNISRKQRTGQKYMYKSMSIGGQISQVAGVYYPHKIDNYIKIVKGEKLDGRYMDDTHIIHESKEHLAKLLKEIVRECAKYGIFVNMRKTQIVKLSHGFTILKMKYYLHPETGTITRIPDPTTFARERRKIKKYKRRVDAGAMTQPDSFNSYQSWRGNIIKYDCYRSVQRTDEIFNNLFFKEECV